MNIFFVIIISLLILNFAFTLKLLLNSNPKNGKLQIEKNEENFLKLKEYIDNSIRENRELQKLDRENVRYLITSLDENFTNNFANREKINEQKLENIRTSLTQGIEIIARQMLEREELNEKKMEQIRINLLNSLEKIDGSLKENSKITEEKLFGIRETVATSLEKLNKENNIQIEKMRGIVDEKLEKTLNDRISRSFQLVNDRLEQVHKGLGEMQNLATGVGDLKKMLSNVKTRGIAGEIQLGNILGDILTKGQYEENIKLNPHTDNMVEFAVKMPGNGSESVYLPIDSKFPGDLYEHLVLSYESGNAELIKKCQRELIRRIKSEAKDISTKYLYPPNTTEFAIMFLPIEGLYAEVIKLGLVDEVQREYKVIFAGPTTMAALLNSIQLGFRTLDIQKRTGEVWKVLEGVKKEFGNFEEALVKAQRKVGGASKELDALIGTRSNMMKRQLDKISRTKEELEKIAKE